MLSKLDVKWLSHQEYATRNVGKLLNAQHTQSMRVGRQLFQLASFRRLARALGGEACVKASIYQSVFSEVSAPVELIHSIPPETDLLTNSRTKVWIPNTIVTRSLLIEYPEILNLCPRAWTTLERIVDLMCRVTSSICARVLRRTRYVQGASRGVSPEGQEPQSPAAGAVLSDTEIAFFPNYGIFYSRLYLKDHFYSLKRGSPFFHEKIAHFELHGNDHLPSYCLDYYKSRNIRNYDWRTLPFDKAKTAIRIAKFLLCEVGCALRGTDLNLLIVYAKNALAIWVSQSRLQQLPKLKIVLIGADLSFPQTLAAACALSGVQTVAVQERMSAPWFTTPSMIDQHFIIGPEVGDYLKANVPTKTVFHDLGPVRMKDHAKAIIPPSVSSIREKYSWIVLALDFHSVAGWFENGRCIANTWRSNAIFYDHLLRLCDDFQEAFFLLKGKNTDFLRIPFFVERVGKLRAQPNLLILEDLEEWTPFSAAMSADIAIARYTSLADEMLALGKPAIFDDFDGFPSEAIDFGPEVLARDYDELKSRLGWYFANPENYNEGLDALRKKFYFSSVGPVEQVLGEALETIWNQTTK